MAKSKMRTDHQCKGCKSYLRSQPGLGKHQEKCRPYQKILHKLRRAVKERLAEESGDVVDEVKPVAASINELNVIGEGSAEREESIRMGGSAIPTAKESVSTHAH